MTSSYASKSPTTNAGSASTASSSRATERSSLRAQSYAAGAAALAPTTMRTVLAESAPPRPDAAAPAGTLDSVAALLEQGLLTEAMASLQGIVQTERDNGSGGNRERLGQASAALAVTQSLVAAKSAVEGGTAADAARHRKTASEVLSRAASITGPLRTALVKQTGIQAGPDAVPAQEASTATAPKGYDPAIGQALARKSAAISGGNPVARGRCYARVADAVDVVIGRFLYGGHAYMAAAQLAAKTNLFTEVGAENLAGLPAGAIVVWGKGSSESGHISISLGDGRESSDFVGRQMLRHYGGASARVFLPKGRMGR